MKLKIVFFGSGPVAAESLRLLSQNFDIEAVVTKPTTKDEMLQAYDTQDIYTVSDKTELDDLFATKKFNSKVGVLIDFDIIVSTNIIDYFLRGIVNSHFSLLPELRGADPISFAILEGKDVTGVSLMLLVEAMDEGPIIAMDEQQLDGTETGPSLTAQLIQLSNDLLRETLEPYVLEQINDRTGDIPVPRSQEEICSTFGKAYKPTYTRKLTKADGRIDWQTPAAQLDRDIRAFIEWPKSRVMLGNIDVIITKAHAVPSDFGEPGDLDILEEQGLIMVQTSSGYLCIERLKPIGKNEMDVTSFLAGYKSRLS